MWLDLQWVPREDNTLADALTKILPSPARFEWAAARLRAWVMWVTR